MGTYRQLALNANSERGRRRYKDSENENAGNKKTDVMDAQLHWATHGPSSDILPKH
jgi:hypothetical protein